MIIKPTIKWGIWSALVCLAAYAVVFALETIFPGRQPIWFIFRVMDYPSRLFWNASGLLQDDAPRWTTWCDVSGFLFSVIIGFGIGALIYRIFVSR